MVQTLVWPIYKSKFVVGIVLRITTTPTCLNQQQQTIVVLFSKIGTSRYYWLLHNWLTIISITILRSSKNLAVDGLFDGSVRRVVSVLHLGINGVGRTLSPVVYWWVIFYGHCSWSWTWVEKARNKSFTKKSSMWFMTCVFTIRIRYACFSIWCYVPFVKYLWLPMY